MLTYDDCLSFCGMTQDEIDVIALREKYAGLAAIAFAHNVLHTCEGERPENLQYPGH